MRVSAMERQQCLPRLVVAASLAGAAALLPSVGAAVMYQWTTPDGVVGLTDDPGRIPERYRATATPHVESGTGLSMAPAPAQTAPATTGPSLDTDQNGHDQEWWQQRLDELNDQQASLQQQRTDLEQQLAQSLSLSMYTAADMEAQKEFRQQLDDVDHQISMLQAQRAALADEARQAGAPPGWLR